MKPALIASVNAYGYLETGPASDVPEYSYEEVPWGQQHPMTQVVSESLSPSGSSVPTALGLCNFLEKLTLRLFTDPSLSAHTTMSEPYIPVTVNRSGLKLGSSLAP